MPLAVLLTTVPSHASFSGNRDAGVWTGPTAGEAAATQAASFPGLRFHNLAAEFEGDEGRYHERPRERSGGAYRSSASGSCIDTRKLPTVARRALSREA
jgi:hypothetical protein